MEDLKGKAVLKGCYWTELAIPPVYNYEIPIALNSTEFVIVPESKYCDSEGKCLYKYNVISNEWSIIMKYEYDDNIVMSYHTASFNQKTQILYVQTAEQTLIKMDLKNMKVIEIIEDLHDASFASSLVINDKFHVFGGWHSADAKHFVWNDAEKCYDDIHHFNGTFNDHGTVYIKSQNRILVFGGASAKIYSCNLNTNKWEESMTKWPVQFSKFCPGYALTLNEKYIILFIDNDIYVLILDTMLFHKIKVVPPSESSGGRRKCIIVNHKLNSALLVFGFVRQIWSSYSLDVVRIIIDYYANEYLHVLQGSYSHWRIRVDDIVNNMESVAFDRISMEDSTPEPSDDAEF